MADTIIITKLSNGNVSVIDTSRSYPEYNLPSNLQAVKGSNNVRVTSIQAKIQGDIFRVEDVEKVVRADGTEVIISDVDTLYTELETYFFFEVTSSGGGGGSLGGASYIESILAADWVLDGGTGKYYVDAVHDLGTKDLLIEAYNIATNDTEVLDDYERTSTINLRIWSTTNTEEYNVLISNGNGGIQSVVAGTNVTVDNTDPLNPVVSSSGGGGGDITEDGTKLKYGTGSDYGVGGIKRFAGGINSTADTDLAYASGIGAKAQGVSCVVGNDVPRVPSGSSFTTLGCDIWYCETNSVSILSGTGQSTTGYRTRSMGSVMIGSLLNIQSANPTNGTVNKGVYIGASITAPLANVGAANIAIGRTLNIGGSYEMTLIGKDTTVSGNCQRTIALGDSLTIEDSNPNCVILGYQTKSFVHATNGSAGGQQVVIGTFAQAGSWRCTVIGAYAVADSVSSTVVGYGAYSGVDHGMVLGRGGYLIAEGGMKGTLLHGSNINDTVIIGNAYAKYTNPYVEGADEIVNNVTAQNNGTVINHITTASGLDVDSTPTASNVKGAVLDISAGTSTGTAEGGDLTFSSSPGGVSSNVLNSDVVAAKIDASTGVDSRFFLLDVTDGTLKRVQFGADDSAGAGFKSLKIAN